MTKLALQLDLQKVFIIPSSSLLSKVITACSKGKQNKIWL